MLVRTRNIKAVIAWEEFLPIETQYLAKDQNQNHANKDAALVHVCPHTFVAYDADAVSGGETRHANRDTAGEVHEAAEKTIAGLGVEVLCDQDRYDEGVDCDNTRHNDGNEALHHQDSPVVSKM